MRVPAALARASFPGTVMEVLRRLDDAGHRSWLVGGAVRDLLLHRARCAKDFDVATPATPREVSSVFRKVVPTGIEHGTLTVVLGGDAVEVTTFRGEGSYVDARRPESVTFHTDLDADLARRDFTMNALAYDPIGREFRDPFGGRADMRRRLVRAVGNPAERFAEDGLRPMRAVRFSAQLGYGLHPRTSAAIRPALAAVRKVSKERVADELTRTVVAPHAERGLELMRRTGLLAAVLPALAARPARSVDHALAMLRFLPPDPVLRYAAILHVLAPAAAKRVLVDLRLPRRLSEDVGALVQANACRKLVRGAGLPEGTAEVRRWLAREGPERAPALVALASAEARSLGPERGRRALREARRLGAAVAAVLRSGAPLTSRDLAIDGQAIMQIIGKGSGPEVGEALRYLLDRVLGDPALNEAGALAEEVRRWWGSRARRI